MSTTPLSPPQHQNPRRDRQQEMDRMQDAFDLQTGKKSTPRPWHTEKGLSQATKQALDSLEPQKKKSGGFYSETPQQKAQQDQFDAAVKHIQDPPKYKLGPVSAEEKLRSWHKALGSPKHVIDAELAQLKEQEAKK